MADKTDEHVDDTDYSGRPYRLPTVEECLAVPRRPRDGGAVMMRLPDGRRAILVGGPPPGEWFVVGEDGWPDRDQPVDPHRELGIKPLPAAASESPKDGSAGPG